ncbi:HIRAN domain-containing protein [Proteus mirabilis]|uniref:HIRAN domain-containing protein n=1 Tax=Proteus mirabilis TaxID=584 RepID=UPI0020A05AB0|nr:HIRAN domain-containing protein [Proteus mirabilis]
MLRVIDVTKWRKDDEFGIFGIGARDKKILWSPIEPLENIKINYPYLFKESRDGCPDQFWMEVIAYIIGDSLKIDVPKAFPAIMKKDNGDVICGALIEWFYDRKEETFVHAVDFFCKLIDGFDTKIGKQHNIVDVIKLCRAVSFKWGLKTKLDHWISNFVLFDSLIGNSDRHQENWGFVFRKVEKKENGDWVLDVRLSPLYDNGTSLGHEKKTSKIACWGNYLIDNYLDNGFHHVRISREEPDCRLQHFELVIAFAYHNASYKQMFIEKLKFDIDTLKHKIYELCKLDIDVNLTPERAEWIIRLLTRRYQRISLILNMRILEKIIEPTRLLLTWQPPEGGSRFLVAIIRRDNENYQLEYQLDTLDFQRAVEKGFSGHPSFDLKQRVHTSNVLEPFLRRLPPKKRTDFAEYLELHKLPSPFEFSDFALLGYTGAKSPADGFAFVIDLDGISEESEHILEVAGTRYLVNEGLDLSVVHIGERVQLQKEPENLYDSNAIAIYHPKAGKLGYINKVLCTALEVKVRKNKVSAFILKKNGTEDRPLIYLLLEIEK